MDGLVDVPGPGLFGCQTLTCVEATGHWWVEPGSRVGCYRASGPGSTDPEPVPNVAGLGV